jgi:hypothetical protein
LQLGHGGAETVQVLFRERRQRRHQHQAAEMPRRLRPERRQPSEGLGLVVAVPAAPPGVGDEQDAPRLRKREAADDRRRLRRRPASAVEQHAALLEGADADARSRAAAESRCDLARAGVDSVETTQRDAGGERELRTRPEADMFGDRLVDAQANLRVDVEMLRQALDEGARAAVSGPSARADRRASYANACSPSSVVRSPPKRPGPPSRSRSQMQARRDRDGDGFISRSRRYCGSRG